MRNARIIGVTLACLIIVSLVSYFILYPPNKVIDPSQPSFSEEKFRLRDYNGASLAHALKVLFPKGTPKEYVDLMLVKRGGAGMANQESIERGRFLYGYKPLRAFLVPYSWRIIVYYNNDGKLESLRFGHYILDKDYKPRPVEGSAK